MTTSTAPNVNDLDTSHAAALADDARAVFAYLARVAREAATIAESSAIDAEQLAGWSPDDEQARDYSAQAAGDARRADHAAERAELAVDAAADFGALAHAAEDIEPAALAEVANALAQSLALALESVAAVARPRPLDTACPF